MWLSFWPSFSSRMSGAPASIAFCGLITGGRRSYSTSIRPTASSAMYLLLATTAATSWPWKRTLSVARTAWVSPESVGIQARPCCAIRSPVTTRTTPGAGPRAGDGGVDRLDPSVSVRAPQDRHVQHVGEHDVIEVVALPVQEAAVLL